MTLVFLKEMISICEAVWIEIEIEKAKNITSGCVYRHPSSDKYKLTNYISKCLTTISIENREYYVTGDFNIDLLNMTYVQNIRIF